MKLFDQETSCACEGRFLCPVGRWNGGSSKLKVFLKKSSGNGGKAALAHVSSALTIVMGKGYEFAARANVTEPFSEGYVCLWVEGGCVALYFFF